MLGTATNTITAPGITSAASRAAQTGPVLIVTSDAGGNLAAVSPDEIVTGSAAFQGLASSVEKNSEGVAMALAMTGTGSILPEGKDFAISANIGTFEGEGAMAFGGVARLSDSFFASGGLGLGTNEGTTGGRAGVTYAW
jgi:hypothetical protein